MANIYSELSNALADVVNNGKPWKEKAQECIDECGSELEEFLAWFKQNDGGETVIND